MSAAIRPLAPAKAPELLAVLGRATRENRNIRALQVHALGAIRARAPEVREALLRIATRGDDIALLVKLRIGIGLGRRPLPRRPGGRFFRRPR